MSAFTPQPIFNAVRNLIRGESGNARWDWSPAAIAVMDAAIAAALAGPQLIARPAVVQIGLTDADFAAAAARLRCTVAQIRAVWEVESGGGWFQDVRASILDLDGPGGFLDGPHLPKILFEAHHFDKRTGGRYRKSHPNISSATWNRALYRGGVAEYERLHAAMMLDRKAALESTSWGGAQIMGFNHASAGFADVESFVAAMKTSERAHLDAFVTFIEKEGLAPAVRQISNVHANNVAFASRYNGPGYAKNDYPARIARAHKKWS